ncbi:hypothetical protein CBFG_00002 [Clostridiales bacterium 1_7_47FAA]|uniref:Uncharacterized protein n=1 Tax=Enterocloster hominis (ex Hitch et al. 2024) TaxID=1917870 RepID=A0ABV1D7L0_9FIRM|nr:hypothetical protein [Lachnoclostridium pacaense]EEQ56293.1 hypothetical protein CBFG_00002 [Clostridiales bacterium 1_7_47FAA]MCC2819020.1 hypothetical protein [Lachnoclostridium pacaense]
MVAADYGDSESWWQRIIMVPYKSKAGPLKGIQPGHFKTCPDGYPFSGDRL